MIEGGARPLGPQTLLSRSTNPLARSFGYCS